MRYKVLILLFVLIGFPHVALANSPNVTIVYSSTSNDVPPEIYKLDALVSRFSEDIHILRDTEVTETSFKKTSHLFYFGLNAATIPSSTRKLINESNAALYGIGFNANQLRAFEKIDVTRIQGVSKFYQYNSSY